MNNKKFLSLFVIAISLSVFLLSSCSKDDPILPAYDPEYLVEYAEFKSYSKEQIQNLVAESELFPANLVSFFKYDVSGIQIIYKTLDTNGDEVLASGALLFPKGVNTALPMISFQHGTIIEDSSAPSHFNSEFNDMGAMFSSTGFVIVMPDFLGYGASSHLEHPYEHRQSLATACRDMIRASKEYFKVKRLNQPSDKLFLTGYSEGGFATMATYKLLQEDHSNEFNINAVTAGAGAYNKSEFIEWVLSSTENLFYMNTYLWVLDTYNAIYSQLQRPYSYYLNEPWASIVEDEGVWAQLDELNPSVLLKSEFIEGVLNGSDQAFISAVADNDCYSWNPQSPLQLYHGTDDDMVPFFNSQSAYNSMLEMGATHVELVPIEGGNHATSIADYAMGTFTFIFSNLN